MRTKHVLMTMVLPALFAACSSDEFVEPAQGELNGRQLLNGLTVEVAQDAQTRFQWSNYSWGFEAGDKFGAAVTDPTLWTVEGDKLLGNYIFEKQANGSYNTNSQMYEGTYLFYSYPGFESKADRNPLKFDLGTQKADLSNPEEVVNNTQFFFSPLYKIEAKNVSMSLPLKFYPYWSVAAFKFKNSTGKAFKISQIALIENSDENHFVTKGEFDAKALEGGDNASRMVYAVAEGASEYTLHKDAKYDETMATGDFAQNETPSGSIVLNCDNYVVANGAEVIAYMSVPAGKHDDLSAQIIVNVDGESKAINVTNKKDVAEDKTETVAATGISTLEFKRGVTKPVFGFETDGKTMKTLAIVEKNLQDANGYFVDNKKDLLNIINSNTGNIKIHNSGDLALDKEVIDAIALYTAGDITFANPIEINAGGNATVDNTTFSSKVTVKNGNITFSSNLTSKLIVEGGKATLKSGAEEIEVKGGELVVAGTDAAIQDITVTEGTLTLNGASQTIGTNGIANLNFEYDTTPGAVWKDINFNVAMSTTPAAAEYKLTINKNVTLTENVTTTIAAKNVVTAGATLKNEGVLTNKGEISAITNEGDIDNAYKIGSVTNGGYIKQTDEWDSEITTVVAGSDGIIDNTVGGVIGTPNAAVVYRVYTGTNPTIKAGELAVLKDVTFTEAPAAIEEALLLGTTDIKAGVEITTLTLGVTKEYETLAAYVLGAAWNTTTNKVSDYNAGVELRIYEGAKLTVTTGTKATEASVRNRGTLNGNIN